MYQYNRKFYDWIDKKARRDAEIILPYLIDWIKPASIIDFGCGEGIWLEVARQIKSNIFIAGMDGDYIDKKRLKIPEETFKAADLQKKITIDRKFDLAISTEVAEHINNQYSEQFIDNITNASDHIFFTAATPGQGGVNHINEKWQSYWIEQFRKKGFFVDLSMRNFFWNEKKITDWRRKNILYFSRNENASIAPSRPCYDVVHPESFKNLNERLNKLDEQYLYCMSHLEVCLQIDDIISKVVQSYENIVIYPYGKNGKICKAILNGKYGKQEFALIDNLECINDVNVFPAEILNEIKAPFAVIDTCSNPNIHWELLEILRNYVNDESIYTVFK